MNIDMRTRPFHSIRTKFTFLSLLIVVPVLFFFMVYYPNQLSGTFELALLNRYQEQAKAASFGLAVGMATENYKLISEGIDRVKKNKELLYIIILDPSNDIIAMDKGGETAPGVVSLKNLPSKYVDASIVRLHEPIIFEEKRIGHLLLGYTKNELDVQLDTIRRLSYFIGSISIALISLLMWLLSSTLTGPLVKMAHAASNFSKGEEYVKVVADTDDEVGELAHSFNLMVAEIKEHHAVLLKGKRFNEDLLATIPSALLTIDPTFRILSVNNSFCTLFQMRPDTVENQPLREVLERIKFPPSTIQSVMYGKEFNDLEVRLGAAQSPDEIAADEKTLLLSLTNIVGQPASQVATTAMLLTINDISQRKHAEEEKIRLMSESHEATIKVKTLSGLLPICSSCKKIRDEHGTWNVLEKYIHDHSEAHFTHGLCPECVKRYFPDQA